MDRVKLITMFLFIAFAQSAIAIEDEIIQWKYKTSKVTTFHADGREAVINVLLKSSKNSRISVTIQILIEGKEAYTYTGNYWEYLKYSHAKKQIAYIVEDEKIKNCSDLEPIKSSWADVHLKVTENKYQDYKATDCKIFTHNLGRETWRSIVFLPNSNIGIVASEFGV